MYVVTPRCAAAVAVVSAVVLRRPTKEYAHPNSMMHRRLPTAGIEVAPHFHQLLVISSTIPLVKNLDDLTFQLLGDFSRYSNFDNDVVKALDAFGEIQWYGNSAGMLSSLLL